MAKLTFDPQVIPVQATADEPALPPERLAPEWLRSRFQNPPQWTPESTDEQRFGSRTAAPTPASVLVPLVVREEGVSLLLTQRTAHLHDHAGQVSFPGGRVDAGDQDAIDTALRESEEEVGLQRRHVEILGVLPDYFTGTGFKVTPVVGLVHPPFELQADTFEVAEIFEVPLAYLMNGKHHQLRTIDLPDGKGRRTFYAMPFERFFIWGATAGMLRNLYHLLRA